MAQIAASDLDKNLEALRAVRDPSINAKGLEALRHGLQSSGGATLLAELLTKSPDLQEILGVWEAQLTAKDDEVIVAMLLLLADMISLLASPPSQEQICAGRELVSYVISRRLKALYFYLSSDSKPKTCAALVLLSAVARHSVQSARQLAQAFDFSLSALAKLCRLPREKKNVGDEEAHSRLLEAWQAPELIERPTISLFIDFALSLLAHADAALLQCLLPVRILWSGLLSQLAHLPPVSVLQILAVTQESVLSLDVEFPASLRTQPFSDTALLQIASVAAWDIGGASAEVTACAAAAQQLLVELMTNSSHGIAPIADFGVWAPSYDTQPSRRRVLRLLHTLKVTSSGAHYDLLLSAARQRPDLASAYLVSCPLSLDPKPGLRWLAGSSLLGSLIQLSPDTSFEGFAARHTRPQGLPSQLLSRQICQIFPSPLFKGVLTKGLQHNDNLVQQATLTVLYHMLSALARTLSALERAQWHAQKYHDKLASQLGRGEADPNPTPATLHTADAVPKEGRLDLTEDMAVPQNEPDDSSVALGHKDPEPQAALTRSAAQVPEIAAAAARLGAWKSLCARLRSAAATKLPDLQALMALHAQLLKPQDAAQAADDAEPGPAQLSGADLIMLHLMKVMKGYMRCLPGLCRKSRFNAWQLLSQDEAFMHPSLQHAALSVLQASLDSSQGASGTVHASAEQLAALLQLLQLRKPGSSTWELAYGAAQSYLHQTVGFDNPAEVHLWLDSLSAASTSGRPAREAAAVASFLAEAVALLLRKPHEVWELQQGILDAASTGSGPPLHQPDASLLPITALRQAIRVAGSSKMLEAAITAICSYVADVLGRLSRVQADRRPLSTIIIEVIKSHGSASAAGSLSAGFQGSAQAGLTIAADHGLNSNVFSGIDPSVQPPASKTADAGRPAKRQRKEASSISPAQPTPGAAGDDSQNGGLVSTGGGGTGKSSGRKGVRRNGSHGHELAVPQEGSHAAWEALQRLRAVAESGIEAPNTSCDKDGDEDGIKSHFRVIDCLPGVQSSKLMESVAGVPVRQRAVPALAMVCALTPEALQPVSVDLLKGLHFCLLEREGEENLCRDRIALIISVLKHPRLLSTYLASSGQHEHEHQDVVNNSIAELLARLLDCAEAADTADDCHISSAWSEVMAAVQPYLARTLLLLEEVAASRNPAGPNHERAPYLILARHLPFRPAAIAAIALLERRRQGGHAAADTWTTVHGIEVASGLLKHTAVRADPVAALRQLQPRGLLSRIADNVSMNAKAGECLVELLTFHASAQGLLAWQLEGEAYPILEAAVASPSEARCQLAAILLRALPLDHSHAVHLLTRALPGMSFEALATLLPVMRVILETQAAQVADSNSEQLVNATSKVLLGWMTNSNPEQRGAMNKEAANSLLHHAVPVLELGVKWCHFDTGRLLQLLQQLAFAEVWTAPTLAFDGSPSPAQKIALSTHLVRELATRNAVGTAVGDPVAWFGAAVLSTTARLIRRQDPEGPEEAPLGELEAIAGELLPELLSQQPLQLWQQDSQTKLLAALKKLAIAVLRCRYRSPKHLSLLTGLLASLLHGHSSCPAAAELAADLAELVVLHSEFQPLMAQLSVEPLPPAATQLAVPLTSLLPFISVHDGTKHQAMNAKQAVLELLTVLLLGGGKGASAQLATHWDSLLAALLTGYGATRSPTDQATLRLLFILSGARRARHTSAGAYEDEPPSALHAWMTEGIPGVGFVFGGAAKTILELGCLSSSPQNGSQRAEALMGALAVDARRCSLTVVHWPEEYLQRLSELVSAEGESATPPSLQRPCATHPAAYDPAFLLPFILQVIREELLPCLEIATSGLLAVTLRGLACGVSALRSCSYEALALYSEALEKSNFREKTQVSVLMGLIRQTVQEPLQRLPALTAVYLAEASCLLTHPGCDLFPAVSRHLLRKPSLDLEEAPLLKQLLSSSSPEQAAERLWLARLLAAGFQDQAEGDIFRRQFVAELLMSIHDSALADAELATSIEGVICNICTRAPTYATDLVQQAGLVSWLSATITSKMQQHREPDVRREVVHMHAAGHGVKRLLAALQALLRAKDWRTAARSGSLGALDVFAKAAAHFFVILAESCTGWWTLPGAAAILRYALGVQQRVNASWDEEMSQPVWQPWSHLMTLFSAEQAGMPEAHRALLLQLVLASPPPCQAEPRSFVAIACWALDAALELCQHAEHPPAVTESLHRIATAQQEALPQLQHAASQLEPYSLAARVLPWLALCLASKAAVSSPSMAATTSSAAPDCTSTNPAAQQAGRLPPQDRTGLKTAERVVQLYYALGRGLRDRVAPAAAFAWAQLLQPSISVLLMGNSATLGQVRGKMEWRFLLGNTLLRMLSHLKCDQDQRQKWRMLARDGHDTPLADKQYGSVIAEEEQAALDVLLVMLPEFCMQQPPVLTGHLVREWELGKAGQLKQRLAELEVRHARAVGVALQSQTSQQGTATAGQTEF